MFDSHIQTTAEKIAYRKYRSIQKLKGKLHSLRMLYDDMDSEAKKEMRKIINEFMKTF
jgi:hypothetical protein